METLQIIGLILYIVTFMYYMYELGKEMIDWAEHGECDALFYKAMILSLICGIIPVVNTIIAIKLFKDRQRLK